MRLVALFICPVLLLAGCGEEILHDQPITPGTMRSAETLFGL